MEQRYIQLFDVYTHGGMSRREFMDKLRLMSGSAAIAPIMLQLENNYAHADTVPTNDTRLTVSDAAIGGVKGHLAIPKGSAAKLGAVIVIHENRGLNPHIKDVTRRVALEGFVAFGPDFLTPLGGTPDDPDKARDMIGTLKPEEVLGMSKAVRAGLAGHESAKGKVGAIGFCWGGGQVNALAVADPDLAAGVAYYGGQPKGDVSSINAALLLHYAGLDERINAGIRDFEERLKAAGKAYEIQLYDGANHAFNNDTNPARYNKEAADLAWGRTVAFLKKHVGSAPA
jgi:carboxymethylenebutenolidase